MKPTKSKIRFCWECGRKLQGNYAYEMVWEGHSRIFHKSCAEFLLKSKNSEVLQIWRHEEALEDK